MPSTLESAFAAKFLPFYGLVLLLLSAAPTRATQVYLRGTHRTEILYARPMVGRQLKEGPERRSAEPMLLKGQGI